MNRKIEPLPQPAEIARKRRPFRAILIILGLLTAGGALGYLIGTVARDSLIELTPALQGGLVQTAILLILAIWFSIVFHELGHLFGGWLSGFRFLLFVAGPLRMYREKDRIKVGFNRSLSLVGGLAASLPSDNIDLVRRMQLYVASGPLASLLLVLLLFVPPISPVVDVLLLFTGVTSLFIGIATLLPLPGRGFLTDGRRLLRLLGGGQAADRESALLSLNAFAQSPGRPRDMDPEILDSALEGDRDMFTAVADYYAYYYHLDRGEIDLARDDLARAIDLWDVLPSTLRFSFALEAAYFEAAHRADVESAEAWMGKSGNDALVEASTRLRAEAAIAAAHGESRLTEKKVKETLKALQKSNTPALAVAEKDWLITLKSIAEASS